MMTVKQAQFIAICVDNAITDLKQDIKKFAEQNKDITILSGVCPFGETEVCGHVFEVGIVLRPKKNNMR